LRGRGLKEFMFLITRIHDRVAEKRKKLQRSLEKTVRMGTNDDTRS
jgi:hypothetical protein